MALNVAVEIAADDREVLRLWTRSSSVRAGLVQRARIVLLAGEGVGTAQIMDRTHASKPTVIRWKRRFSAEGLAGLGDRRKSGRPRVVDDAAVVVATLEPPPASLGVTHWSTRLLASELGVSNFAICSVWKKWNLRPWRVQTFKFSTDPQLEAKIRDVVGLYLNPPENAIVVCVDEKSQIQALDRADPADPPRPAGKANP